MTQSLTSTSPDMAGCRPAHTNDARTNMGRPASIGGGTAQADCSEVETLPRLMQFAVLALILISTLSYFALSHGVHNHVIFLIQVVQQVAEKL